MHHKQSALEASGVSNLERKRNVTFCLVCVSLSSVCPRSLENVYKPCQTSFLKGYLATVLIYVTQITCTIKLEHVLLVYMLK